MIKHRDIARAHALLEGENWHIESGYSRGTDRKRRDKRSCTNYNKENKCCILNGKLCVGSSGCVSYDEW